MASDGTTTLSSAEQTAADNKATRLAKTKVSTSQKEEYATGSLSKAQEDLIAAKKKRIGCNKIVDTKGIADAQKKVDNSDLRLTDRQRDILEGSRFGEAILGEDGLGRLQEDAEMMSGMEGIKRIADEGLSRQELAGERSRMSEGINRSTQTASRGLQAALARSGVRGATAGRQLVDVEVQGLQARQRGERDLFLKSEGIKREGLNNYVSKLGKVKAFDLGQNAKEMNIIMSAGMGFAQIGQTERSAKLQAQAQVDAAKASGGGGGGGCF